MVDPAPPRRPRAADRVVIGVAIALYPTLVVAGLASFAFEPIVWGLMGIVALQHALAVGAVVAELAGRLSPRAAGVAVLAIAPYHLLLGATTGGGMVGAVFIAVLGVLELERGLRPTRELEAFRALGDAWASVRPWRSSLAAPYGALLPALPGVFYVAALASAALGGAGTLGWLPLIAHYNGPFDLKFLEVAVGLTAGIPLVFVVVVPLVLISLGVVVTPVLRGSTIRRLASLRPPGAPPWRLGLRGVLVLGALELGIAVAACVAVAVMALGFVVSLFTGGGGLASGPGMAPLAVLLVARLHYVETRLVTDRGPVRALWTLAHTIGRHPIEIGWALLLQVALLWGVGVLALLTVSTAWATPFFVDLYGPVAYAGVLVGLALAYALGWAWLFLAVHRFHYVRRVAGRRDEAVRIPAWLDRRLPAFARRIGDRVAAEA